MTEGKVDPGLVSGYGIRRVLAFLPFFSDPEPDYGECPTWRHEDSGVSVIVSSRLSKPALEFLRTCHEENLLQPFDWINWGKEQKDNLNSDEFIGKASLETLIKLLTGHVRHDKFMDGHLLCVMSDGTILKILQRLEEIYRQRRSAAGPARLPEDLRGFVASSEWTFAWTMPQWPHEYIVRDREEDGLFVQLALHIREHGYEADFRGKTFTYFDEEGYSYWTLGAPLEKTVVINRCRKEK